MLHTAAHEGAEAAVFNAGRGHSRDRESSAWNQTAGAVVEKTAPGQSAGAIHRELVLGDKLEDSRQEMVVRRTLRWTFESAKCLKSRVCVRTHMRPVHGSVANRYRLFHGVRRYEGLESGKGAHPGADRARQAARCVGCEEITAPP